MSSKKRNRKKSFFASYAKSIRDFILKLAFILINIGFFIFIIYKAYKYALDPVDLQNIPLIKYTNKPVKKKFNKNDGLIFLNQDKVIYNTIMKNSKSEKGKETEKILQDFSHQQIFDIVQDIKNVKNTPRQMGQKSKKVDVKNNKKKISPKNIQKYGKRNVFQVLDTE